MKNDQSRRFLVAAVIWTVVAGIALGLLFVASGGTFGKLCGVVLVALCLIGQWLRYFRSR